MIEVALIVRDEQGRLIEVPAVGVDELVKVIRARPPDPGPGEPRSEQDLDLAVFGPAMHSLQTLEQVSRQVAALRAACVAAVADETPGGAGSDQALDEVACALVVSRRSAQFTQANAETLRHQPLVWAALAGGEMDLTRARILANALYEIPPPTPTGYPGRTTTPTVPPCWQKELPMRRSTPPAASSCSFNAGCGPWAAPTGPGPALRAKPNEGSG